MNYFVDIDETNNIVVHKTDCNSINDFKKMFITDYFHTYDDVMKHAQKKELIYEFHIKYCICCKPCGKLRNL